MGAAAMGDDYCTCSDEALNPKKYESGKLTPTQRAEVARMIEEKKRRSGIELSDEVRVFAELIELRLRLNQHHDWRECSDDYLKRLLEEGCLSVTRAIAEDRNVAEQCGAVGSIAMMIADKRRRNPT
jgi:hypothetical protein